MALKILHTADWHLGLEFPSYDEEAAKKLSRARADAVKQLLFHARQAQADAVLCAGDLFDAHNPPRLVWQHLVKIFETCGLRIPIILLPGNHDPHTHGSVYLKDSGFRLDLPPNVIVADRDDFSYELGDEAIIYARPCFSKAGASDPIDSIPPREPGDERIRIGMVHGQVEWGNYFPIDPEKGAAKGLDYLAMGDFHSWKEYANSAGKLAVYPGAPEPAHHGESGAGKVALVFFSRSRMVRVQPVEVGQWTWRQERCETFEAFQSLLAEDLEWTNLRLTLDMSLPLHAYVRAEEMLEELAGSHTAHPRAGILQVAEKNLRLIAEQGEALPGDAPAIFHAVVDKLRADPDRERAERALYHLYTLAREVLNRSE
jgi:DNA repair exonuclease SbcCD nuclease subunit